MEDNATLLDRNACCLFLIFHFDLHNVVGLFFVSKHMTHDTILLDKFGEYYADDGR